MNLKKFSHIVFVLPLLFIGGCDLAQNHLKADREGSFEMQDYRDALASRVQSEETEQTRNKAGIPNLQPYVASPNANIKPMPLVSLSVNQSVPLKDILFELAKQAEYDLELDPRISGSIIFTARERPFDEVIDRISDVAVLRYNFDKNDVLRIELDTPYSKLYKIDYLSYIRSSTSSVTNEISVVSGDGTDSGSSFSAQAEGEADFWAEVETNLTQILGTPSSRSLNTGVTPQISVAPQNLTPQDPGIDSGNISTVPDAVLNVESLPVGNLDGGGVAQDTGAQDTSFTINRQAGLINVFATQSTHKEVLEYLDVLKKSVTSQVLIEAKILEVTLNDQFETGIDWELLDVLSGEGAIDFLTENTTRGSNIIPTTTSGLASTGTSFVAGFAGNDIQAFINAISAFGTVKALASPRLTVINNQPAVLNVATNRVFFEVEIDRDEDENGNEDTTITTEIQTVPVGVLLNVQPSINLDNRTVSLALRPSITRVSATIDNVGVQLAAAESGLTLDSDVAGVPELSVQEVDSVIMTRSGQPIVMGGLLQDRVQSTQNGVPVLSEIPMAGALFRDQTDSIVKTELVIFLKTTILDSPSDSVHATDKDLYRKFSSDRRPLRL